MAIVVCKKNAAYNSVHDFVPSFIKVHLVMKPTVQILIQLNTRGKIPLVNHFQRLIYKEDLNKYGQKFFRL